MSERYSHFGCRFITRKSISKDLYLPPAKAQNWAGLRTILSIFLTIFQLHLYLLVELFSSRQLLCGRNGSFCNTFMAKSDFWSSSLPRSLPRRKVKLFLKSFVMQMSQKKVTFDDETPERPPPPPPARLQSINTMKDFSGVSQAYNQVRLKSINTMLDQTTKLYKLIQ